MKLNCIVVDLRGNGHSANPENRFTPEVANKGSCCLKSLGLIIFLQCEYFDYEIYTLASLL